MKLELDMLRHGKTCGGGGFRGRLDDELSERGWSQLRDATAAAGPWHRIISSPLRRCAAFASQLAQQRDLPFELEPQLRELDFGAWEGLTAADLMVSHSEELARFWNDPYAFTPPQGEPVVDFEARVLSALERLTDQYAGERVLLVTHAGVMRLLLAEARGLPRAKLLQVEVGHAALCGLTTGFHDVTLWLEERCGPF